MLTSDILNRAADLIEQRGHWKGWYCGPNGELCLRGALFAAVGVEPQPRDRHDTIDRWPGYSTDRDSQVTAATVLVDASLPRLAEWWNDAEERTEDDVTAALRGAAEAARAER